jgi:putative AdoMet-dependent methyltransferase
MLNKTGFDLWADGYDKSVGLRDDNNEYPFAGYRSVLGRIYSSINQSEKASVLDIGIGTAVLASRLYDNGHVITGIDFSEKMLETASGKMPNARLILHDFNLGLPETIKNEKFDFIVTTYFIHHFGDTQKAEIIKSLLGLLNPDGKIFIGDVAFETRQLLKKCRLQSEEIYTVADELIQALPGVKSKFDPVSFCSGIFTIGAE